MQKHYIIIILILIIPFWTNAQGGIDKVITRFKDYKPSISDANKLKFFPEIIDSTQIKSTPNYSITTKPLFIDYQLKPINAAKLEGEPLTKLYRSYIKLGFGNYFTPLAEIYYNTLRSKKHSFGAYYKHLSSSGKLKIRDGKVYAGFSDNAAGAYVKKFLKKRRTLLGDLKFAHNSFYYYGYTPYTYSIPELKKEDLDKQSILSGGLNLCYKNNYTDSNHLNYLSNLNYQILQDHYKNQEHEINLNGTFSKFYGDELFGLTGDITFFNNKLDSRSMTSALVRIKPWASIVGDQWRIETGLKITTESYSDSIFYHIYPQVQLQYNIIDNFLIPYIGFDGKLQNNSYRSSLHQNPYITPGLYVKNNNHAVIFYAGLKGNFTPKMTYNIKGSYSVIDNMHFFINDSTLLTGPEYSNGFMSYRNRFTAVYDNVEQMKLHGELVYKQSDKWNFILKGNYYNYALKNEAKAWNMPNFDMSFTTKYNIRNKILLNADIFAIGKRYAKAYANNAPVIFELKEVLDANLGIEYRYSKILSGFININNITAGNYSLWHGYPMQGINIMFGLTYSL